VDLLQDNYTFVTLQERRTLLQHRVFLILEALRYGTACLTADWESNCLSWPIELAIAFQVLASKSKIVYGLNGYLGDDPSTRLFLHFLNNKFFRYCCYFCVDISG